MHVERIIFLSAHNPWDPTAWSGIPYSIFHELIKSAKGSSVEIIHVGRALRLFDFAARVANRVFRFCSILIDTRLSKAYAFLTGAYLTIRLLPVRNGVIVAIAAAHYLPYLVTRRKIIYISDATFSAMSDSYPSFKVLPQWQKVRGNHNEASALCKSQFVLYPSQWAADSARADYNVPACKIHQLPFGPTIPEDLIKEFYEVKSIDRASEVVVAFVAADWDRKQGDKVIAICRLLIQAGLQIRLILVGNIPKAAQSVDFVDYRGFLRKSERQQLLTLCTVYREAHFLLLPTAAEAFGIVFSEAQAFGMPPVTHDIGGTASALASGAGLLLAPEASPQDFADKMLEYVDQPDRYRILAERCRKNYLERANWRNWATLILELSHVNARSAEPMTGSWRVEGATPRGDEVKARAVTPDVDQSSLSHPMASTP